MTKQSENVISGGINEKVRIENERWELLREGKVSLFAETMAWVEAWRASGTSEGRLRERLEAWLESCFHEGLLLDKAQQAELQASLLRMLAPKPVSDAVTSHVDTAVSVSQTSDVGASVSTSQTSEVGASVSTSQASDVGASVSASQTSEVGASVSASQTSDVVASVSASQTSDVGDSVSVSAQISDVVVFPMVPYEEEVSAPAAAKIWESVASLASQTAPSLKEDAAKIPVVVRQSASEGSVASEGSAALSTETTDVPKVSATQDVPQAPSREPAVGLPTGASISSSLYARPKGREPARVGDPSKQGGGKAKSSEVRGRRSGLGSSEQGDEGASLSDVLPDGATDASDLTELPELSWQERHSREDRAVMEASSWARVLQPFLAQNWLYFLGTFLVLASGFYLLSLAWEGMSTLGRQAVIWGSLATGSLAFSGLGVLLKQRAELQVAGRSFGAVSLGLLGIAGMAVGPLWSSSLPVAIGVMGGTLGLLVWGLGWVRAMDAGPTIKLATISSGVLLGGVIFVPWFGRLGHIWGVVGVLSLGTLFFWGVVRVWGAVRFGVLNWGEVWCFWRGQGGFDRVRAAEGQEQPLTAQEMLFFFLPQAYLWLLLVGWSGWSLGSELWLALPYLAPLCGVVGFALVEMGEWVRLIERGENKERAKAQQKALRAEDEGTEGFFVWFWLGALVVTVGVVQAWGTPISLVWGACLLGVLFARGSDVRARWSLEALSALSGVVGYVALLGVLFASSEFSSRWMREVWGLPMQAWWMLPAGVCLVVVGRRVREQREMRGQVWPLLGALLAVYGVGVLLLNDVLRGQGQVSLGMLLAMPLYALGFLYVGELREKKSWSRLGLVLWVYGSAVIGGRVFSWGVFSGGTEDRASWSLLVFVVTAALLWGVSRVFERRALLPHSRFVLDEALLWLPLVLLFFWAQQPDVMGLSNLWGWHPRTAFVWGAVGLWLYGAFFFWWSYASHSAGMARWTLVWWGLASVLLSVSVRRWLGLPLGQGNGALVVMCVSFVLFELGMRWRGGSRAKGMWLRLPWVDGEERALFAGDITEGAQEGGKRGEVNHGVADISEGWGLWRRPLLEAAHVAWLVGLLMLFRVVGRGIEGRGLALAVLCLGVVFAWQVAWRHQAEAMGLVGFVLSGVAWSVAWLWPHLLGASMEQARVWWGVLGIAGGFWAVWSMVLWGVYGWKGGIDERGDWKGVLLVVIEILPLFGMAWMVGLGYLTVWAIKENAGVSVGWLFAGWGGSVLLWYGMARVMRRWLWVWLGASSLLVCWVLPWWNALSLPGLLVCAMGGVLVLFALGSWGGWKRKTADVGVLLKGGQAWLTVRSEGAQLWGEGHRVYGLAWCLLSLPGLWWFWREGWMVGGLAGLGLGLSILPMFWEGWQGSGASWDLEYGWFGLSLFAAGVGCTVGLFGALPGSWQPVGVWLWLSSFGVVSGWVALFVMLCVGLRDRRSLRLDWVSRRGGMCSQGQPQEGVGWGWLRLGQVSEWMFVGAACVGLVCFGMAWWGDRAASGWLLWSVLPCVASVWLRPREVTAMVVGGMMLWGWWWGAAAGWVVWAVVWSALLPLWAVGSSYWREKPLAQLNGSVGWTGLLGGMSFGVGVVSALEGVWPSSGAAWLGCVGSLGVATLYQVGMWIARWQGGRLEPLFEMVAWGRASEDEGRAGRWGVAWQSLRDLYKTAMVVGSGFALWWLWLSWPNGGVVLALFLVPALLDVSQSFQRFSWTWMMMALSLWGLHVVPYWMQKESWSVWLWSVWVLGALWLAAESTAAALWHGLRERGSLRMVWALWHIRGLSASMALFFAGCGILLYAALLAGFVLEPIGYPLEVSVYWLKDARALPWWIWLLVPVLYAVMVFQLRRRSALFWAGGAIFLSPLVMGAVLAGRSWRALAVECAVGVWLLILGGLLVWVRAQGALLRQRVWGDGEKQAKPSKRSDVLQEAAEAWTPTSIYRLYYKEDAAEPAWLRELTAFAAGLEGPSAQMLEQRLRGFLWELPLLGALWLGARHEIARLGGLMGSLGLGVVFAFVPASISVRGGGFWGVCLLCVGSAVFVRVRPWRSLWALGATVFGLLVFGGLWDGLFGPTALAMGAVLGMGLVCCVLAAWWLRASQSYWSEDRVGWRYSSSVESFLRIAVRGGMWRPSGEPQVWDGAEDAGRWEDRNLPLVQKGYRALGFNSFVLLWLAWGMFWTASARVESSSPMLLHGMAVLLLMMQSWLWVGWALERDRDWMAYVGFASFLGVYGYLRSVMEIGERGLDAWVFLVVGFVLLGFRELWQRMGGRLLQRVAQRISYVLPLLALLSGVWGGKIPPIASWLIAGVFYGILAHQYGLRWLAVPALGFLNVGIFLFLGQQAVSTAQWYILPLGLSMFAISGIFAMDLGHKGRNFFRVVGALAIYLTSMVQVLSFRSITDVLLLAGLAIVGMIAGIALQIRSFLLLGLGFLVADIVINLFRIGVQDRVIGMIFLFLTGILLLAAAVFFNLKREAILARIRDWQDQMASWD